MGSEIDGGCLLGLATWLNQPGAAASVLFLPMTAQPLSVGVAGACSSWCSSKFSTAGGVGIWLSGHVTR